MTTININGPLILDQTAGIQDDDTAITSQLVGLSTAFATALNTLPTDPIYADFAGLALDTTQRTYADTVEAAVSGSDFVTVTDLGSSTLSGLRFSDANGDPLDGDQVFYPAGSTTALETLDGSAIYLHNLTEDIVLATTSPIKGAGEIVAAFYLNQTGTTASVEQVTFIPIKHPDATNPDDQVDWTDLLQVSADTSLAFDFDTLKSGKFLWVAVGDSSEGLLLTGKEIRVNQQTGEPLTGNQGGDMVNTSQGGNGATIGIDNQMMTPGDGAILTLVTGFSNLGTGPHATGQDVDDLQYTGYINTTSAGMFVSQEQGSGSLTFKMAIWSAGGVNGTTAETGQNYDGDATASALADDVAVAIQSVTVGSDTWTLAELQATTPVVKSGGVAVTLTANNEIRVSGADAGDTVTIFTNGTATFNRIELTPEVGKFDIGRITLSRGDTTSTGVGDDLKVDDDGPTLSGQSASEQVEEDELSSSAPAPQDTSTGITDNDGFTDEVTFANSDLQLILNSGTDAPATFSLVTSFAPGTAVKDVDGNAMTSKGDAITWSVNGSVIEAVAGGRVVFTITQTAGVGTSDPTDDLFAIDLRDQIDHPDGSGDNGVETLNLTPAFVAKDHDGDAADLDGAANDQEPIQLVVENDVPEPIAGATISEEVHEDKLTGGNLDNDETETVSASYTETDLNSLVNPGADEDLTFSLNTAASGTGAVIGTNVVTTGDVAVTSAGLNVTWAAGDTAGSLKGITTSVDQTVKTIFTLTPSGTVTGAFDFVLLDQLDHSGVENDQELLPLDLSKAFKAVDFDKDPVTLNNDSVVLNVENDLPIIESQISGGTVDWVANNTVKNSLNGRVGGDDPGSYIIDAAEDITGYIKSGVGTNTVNYFVDTDPNSTSDAPGPLAFSLVVNDTNSIDPNNPTNAGMYTFTVHQPAPQEQLEFNFDNLASGNFLWVAVGTNDDGLLVTGSRLNLKTDGTAVSGGKLASDQVNTSQGGAGATIGIDNQMFTPGDSGIFTFVQNFDLLPATEGDVTGQDIDQIQYGGYINTDSASLFISQKQGNTKLDLTMSIFEAGTGSNGTGTQVDEEGSTYASGGNISGSGNQAVLNKSSTFLDDHKVDMESVEIRDGSNILVGTWTTDADAANASTTDSIFLSGHKITGGTYNGVQATITDNSVDINGVDSFYSVKVNADDNETFNRIELQADGGKFDIGKFVLEQGQDTPDLDIDFSVAMTDKDADLAETAANATVFDDFTVKVDGTGVFNDGIVDGVLIA